MDADGIARHLGLAAMRKFRQIAGNAMSLLLLNEGATQRASCWVLDNTLRRVHA